MAEFGRTNGSAEDIDLAFQSREIARLREKLLDLTRRNGLLNFRHSRGGAFVRVVDELPDGLLETLQNGEMGFEPLPDPESEPADERTETFQNAMAIGRLTDETYLTATAELGEAEADTERLAEADEALRHRVRASLGLPKLDGGKKLDIAELARANGFDPSFDLRRPPHRDAELDGITPAHLDDDRIRILLTRSQAERRLRTIFDRNRTLENETGIHTLQIAFGFIEWADPKQPSAGPYHAPLLTMPLNLRRKIVGGNYHFWASAPEGELLVNLALVELLKRDHGVALPAVGEDETPEVYFARLAPALEAAKFLELRRFVTIAIFPFPRMGLWADLDETIWPEDGLRRHAGLARLLGGLSSEGAAGTFGVDHPIEDEAWAGRVPPLVMPADVSQHSAILDAMEGKDLVVEGPPGTGKSQTIANLIAAAIGAGRRVLFLAEKRTALEAVAKRLNERGLGPTLLELHSEKTSKPEVMASLAAAVHNGETKPARLPGLRAEQRHEGKLLRDYHSALQTKPDGHERTTWQLIWKETALRRALAGQMAETILPKHVAGVDLSDEAVFRQTSDTLRELARAAETVEERLGGLQASPWHAARGLPVQPHAQETLLRELSELRQGPLAAVEEALARIGQAVDGAALNAMSSGDLVRLCDALTSLVLADDDRLAAAAFEDRLGEETLAAAAELASIQARRSALVDGMIFDEAALEPLQQQLAAIGFNRVSIDDLDRKARGFIDDAARFDAVAERFRDRFSGFGTDFPSTPAGVETIAGLGAIGRRYPARAWDLQIFVANNRRREHLEELAGRSRTVKERLRGLATEIDLGRAAAHSSTDLRMIGDTVGESGLFGRLFGGAFKRALSEARAIARGTEDRERLRSLLHEAAATSDEWEAIQIDEEGRAAFGEDWQGPETGFAVLDDAAACLEEVGAFLHRRDEGHRIRAALQIGAAQFETELLSDTEARLVERATKDNPLASLAQGLRRRAEEFQALATEGRRIGIRPSAPVLDGDVRLADRLADFSRQARVALAAVPPESREVMAMAAANLAEARAAADLAGAPILAKFFGAEPASNGAARLAEVRALQSGAEALAGRLPTLEATSSAMRERLGERFVPIATDARIASRVGELRKALEDGEGLRLHANLERYLDQASATGVLPLYETQIDAGKPVSALADILALLRCEQALEATFQDPASPIRQSTTGRLDTARGRFGQAEVELYRLEADNVLASARERLKTAPWGNDSGPVGTHTNLALINREMAKQKRHIPIRQLIERAGSALQALKPVLMMSPHALAQYAPPGTLEFDLVVIDEASQMKPEFSVGALARGGQYVIVGDQKQLPPTDFFAAQSDGDGDGDEEAGAADLAESVLDLAASRIPHKRRLRWHYRSQHPALIAFSNREFYDRELVIFPAASESESSGVRCVDVDGIYQANVNPQEAETAIEEARRLIYKAAEDGADLSLGIATMNLKQRDLINAEFERLAASDPIVRAYVERWEKTVEPVFVKNLENVQGDERDVIIISTLFGPAERGARVKQNFGAINRGAGHRRLNVLFTRAKRAMIIVTSLKTGDVVPTPSSSRGVQVFKGFLDYARGGAVYDDAEARDAESPFEEFVAEKLAAAGYDVVHQIGVEGFRIDLAVRHPDDPSVFIAGIECDGAPFHVGLTIRDRDVIRQKVLEGLGWSIWRIWSTDWYNDPDGEAEKLVGFLGRRKAYLDSTRPARSEPVGVGATQPLVDAPGAEQPGPAPGPNEPADEISDKQASSSAEATDEAPSVEKAGEAPQVASVPRPEIAPEQEAEPALPVSAEERPSPPVAPPPRGRHIRRNHLDVYEVLPGLFEVRREGMVIGEVERQSGVGVDRRLTAGTAPSLPRFRGTREGSEVTFTTTDIYEAFDRLDRETSAELAAQ
ncbi:DUF4011 domain-containing protein [Jiella pacifica]|uniref:DUF4011 domain-containing protein n=1 Tax=Jiella pacifica TaxID=2696469 RepID=A0A6N9T8N0_9HYPH|nr:DUF4011 domain-containing protein [Jiella pacifica]NDW06049.1 DUF4011 domain-containing protein [Jiella pacifica]